MVYTDNKFEWDPAKAEANHGKHGVRFEEAAEAFYDPDAITLVDRTHSTEWEIREHLIGESTSRILFVVFTIRISNGKTRIISARKANRRERELYDKVQTNQED